MLLSQDNHSSLNSDTYTQYRIDIQAPYVYLFAATALFTIFGVFYLGFLIGLGARQAPQLPLKAAVSISEEMIDVSQLQINRGLPSNTSASKRTPLQPTKKRLAVSPPVKTAKKSIQKQPKKSLSPPKQASLPPLNNALSGKVVASTVESKKNSGTYSVQVFSSQRFDSAENLKTRLIKLGFVAYINKFMPTQGNAWYRVRVGKTTKSNVEALTKQLDEKAGLKNVQIIQD